MRKAWFQDRWFVLGLLAVLVNAGGWYAASRRAAPGDGRPPRAEFRAPEQAEWLSGSQSVRWEFTAPAAAATGAEIGAWVTNTLVRLTPPLPGAMRWASDRVLEFKPATEWPLCQRYQAELADAAGAIHRPASFHTEPLRLLEARAAPVDGRDGRYELRLQFNAPPLPDSLRRKLALSSNRDSRVEWEIAGGAGTPRVRLETTGYVGSNTESLTLEVLEGLATSAGPLGLLKPAKLTAPCRRPFALSGVTVTGGDGWGEDTAKIHLNFTNRPADEGLDTHISVEPAVSGLRLDLNEWNHRCNLYGPFIPGRAYTVKLRAGLPARNGETLPKAEERTVMIPELSPALRFPDDGRYLSKAGRMALALQTVNTPELVVTARPVYAENLLYCLRREQEREWWDETRPYEGYLGAEHSIRLPPSSTPNQVRTAALELGKLLPPDATGAWMIRVTGASKPRTDEDGEEYVDESPLSAAKVIVLSDIGLLAKQSEGDLLVWANSLHTLKSAEGARLQVISSANQVLGEGVAGPDGLARIAVRKPGGPDETPFLVLARQDQELSFLPLNGTRVDFTDAAAGEAYHRQGYEAFVFTDRGVYRPGETAHVKAVVRDPAFAPPAPFPLRFQVWRPDGGRLPPSSALLTALGTGETSVEFSDQLPTGKYRIEALVPGSDTAVGSTSVWVEDFVPPQIAVEIKPGVERGAAGQPFPVVVSARHLFGAAGAGLAAQANLSLKSVAFQPKEWPGYTFYDSEKSFSTRFGSAQESTTDDEGKAAFELPTDVPNRAPSALEAVIGASVLETSGRAVSASLSVPLDPYPFYVGLKPSRGDGLWPVREPVAVEVAAVLPAGAPAEGQGSLEYRLQRIEWTSVFVRGDGGSARYESQRNLVDAGKGTVALTGGKGRVEVVVKQSGSFLLTVRDPKDGASSSLRFYASVTGSDWNPLALEKPDRLELKPDRESYAPGDTAVLRVEAPHAGKALVTVETDRVAQSFVQDFAANTGEVRLPITADLSPNAYCTVQLLRPVKAGDTPGLHRAVGVARLTVNRPERRLAVRLDAPAEIRPLSTLEATLTVTGLEGRPCEVVLAAVDDGICRLTAFKTPDPLAWFHRLRRLGTLHLDLYSLLLPELGEDVKSALSEAGGDGLAQLGKRLNPVKNKRFKPTALWISGVTPDSNGVARVRLDVPEFTGALRLMAVAVGPDRLGSATGEVKVKRPLVVQTGLPRFLAPGDRSRGSAWFFNESKEPMTVRWSASASGPARVEAGSGELTLAPGADAHAEFRVLAAEEAPGLATISFTATAGAETFTESVELAVRPAAAREGRNLGGRLEPGQTVEVKPRTDWMPGTADGSVRAGPLPALQWQGAYEDLLAYPYGCLEQTLSSAYPLLHAADLFETMLPGRLTREDAARFVQAGIRRVLTLQGAGGWFGWWPGADEPYAYGSRYAVEFLLEAKAAGYDVPEDALARGVDWLEGRLDASGATGLDGLAWQQAMRDQAYALAVLAQAGRVRADWMARLRELKDKLDAPARIHLARALVFAGQRAPAVEILDALPAAPLAASPGFDPTLSSPVQQTALRLRTWLRIDPTHAAIPPLAEALIARRKDGRWATTHDNAQALLALGQYAGQVLKERKPFAATWTLAGKPAQAFSPENPLRATWTGGAFTLENRGPGVVFYTVREDGIPTRATLPEEDRGLRVRRAFLGLDGNPVDPARLKAGALLVQRIELDTLGQSLDQLVVECLLPAGLEVENPVLTSGAQTPWISADNLLGVRHQELRDDRIVLFTGQAQGARAHFAALRAVTPGRYILPAVSAEAMYEPSLRSRHGGGTVEVVP